MKNKPLFNVKLKVWENWGAFWQSLPWYVRKLNSKYEDVGKTRQAAGAYDATSGIVHLFLDEISLGAVNRLDNAGIFNYQNYPLEFVREFFGTLIHELIHSLNLSVSDKAEEMHEISGKKLAKLLMQSHWYGELFGVSAKAKDILFNLEGGPSTEPENPSEDEGTD